MVNSVVMATGMVLAIPAESKKVTERTVMTICAWLEQLNITKMRLGGDGETVIQKLMTDVKKQRTKDHQETIFDEPSLRDSASNGAVESVVRWWQQRVRTRRHASFASCTLMFELCSRDLASGTQTRASVLSSSVQLPDLCN